MSLLDATTQQLVYGPDGRVYGNPALARAAGVNQYYREDGTPYPVATPAASGMGSGDPYSQIMGQMGGATPYERIMARMTPTMNPYTGAGVAIAGYDPSLYRRMSGSGLINFGRGGGGGSGGLSDGGSAGDLDVGGNKNTQVESFADQSARNQKLNDALTSFSKTGLLGLALSGINSLFGTQAPAPVDSLGTSLGGGFGSPAAQGQTSSQSGEGNPGEQPGQTSFDTGVGNPGEQGDGGGYGGGTTGAGNDGGGIGAGEGLAQGGKVTKRHLKGPDPKGPDEGYGALLSGEYVIKKSAVNKYGTGLLDMINDGKIPAKKMKSLLG